MLDQLLTLAKENLGSVVANQPELQNRNPQETASITGQTVLESLTNQFQSGNNAGLMEMLSGSQTTAANPVVSSLLPEVAGKLATRLGISEGTARNLAMMAIPVIMNMLNGQVTDAKKGGMDIGGMLGGLLGGGGFPGMGGNNSNKGNDSLGGLGGMLGGLFK